MIEGQDWGGAEMPGYGPGRMDKRYDGESVYFHTKHLALSQPVGQNQRRRWSYSRAVGNNRSPKSAGRPWAPNMIKRSGKRWH